MHRTFPVPRSIGWWRLFAALAILHVGLQAASAQNPFPSGISAPALPNQQPTNQIELGVGVSRAYQMTTRADLKRVENPNSRVVRVERVPNRNNEILLVADNPGRSMITFVDQNDRVEMHEVVVAFQGKDDAKKLSLPKGAAKTIILDKVPVGGSQVTVGGIVKITPAIDNPKAYTIEAVAPGNTRITWFGDKEQNVILASYDIDVPFQDRAAQLRDIIRQITPTASVVVTVTKIPREVEGKTVFDEAVLLTGTVTTADDARSIIEVASRLFPRTVEGQGASVAAGAGNVLQLPLQGNVINQIRIGGVHTVELQVVVAVVNRSQARNMSFSWNVNGTNWFLSSLIGGPGTLATVLTPLPAGTTATLTPTGAGNLPFGVLNTNSSVLGFLQMLRTEGLTKILAEPRVTTLSGRSASILSGGETPIVLATGVGAPPSVTYKDFGTKVNFLPIVLGNGKIHLEVRPELSQIDPAAGISVSGISAPGFRTRSAQVTVQIEDGQTLAIGGLIQNTTVGQISRIPVLGDLPYLGAVFSSKSYREEEEELIILVTPRLVESVDCTKIPRYLPGRETRSPSDFELFLEGILEAPRGQRSVVFHPHMYKPAYHHSPNAGQYPCNDGSGNHRGGCANGQCAPGHHGHAASPFSSGNITNVGAPLPSFPDSHTLPTSGSRIIIETESPSLPNSSGLGMPMTPSRQQDTRPVLPPLSSPR